MLEIREMMMEMRDSIVTIQTWAEGFQSGSSTADLNVLVEDPFTNLQQMAALEKTISDDRPKRKQFVSFCIVCCVTKVLSAHISILFSFLLK